MIELTIAANKALIESKNDPRKGFKGLYTGSAIELQKIESLIITGKRSKILHSESAVLLNAVKYLAGVPDEIDLLSPIIMESIVNLKRRMGFTDESLDVKEVMDALAVSAVFNPNAAKCLEVLSLLKGCEMHTTHHGARVRETT